MRSFQKMRLWFLDVRVILVLRTGPNFKVISVVILFLCIITSRQVWGLWCSLPLGWCDNSKPHGPRRGSRKHKAMGQRVYLAGADRGLVSALLWNYWVYLDQTCTWFCAASLGFSRVCVYNNNPAVTELWNVRCRIPRCRCNSLPLWWLSFDLLA